MKIFIIDGHPLMREAITIQVRRLQPQASIFSTANLSEFAALTKKEGTPDLVTTELDLSDANGLSTVIQLKSLNPRCPLVVITNGSAALLEDAAITAGADVFISKTDSIADIAAALRSFLVQDSELDTQIGTLKLSKRQKQLMIMLNEGLSNRDIAARIDISEHTVKVHLWRLFTKLDVNSRTQALAFGRNNGLI
jgi:DNA-binding NarL/FixJ family response regulator